MAIRSTSTLADARVIVLAGNPEGARQLTWIELDDDAPFPVRRVYWIHSLADGDERGNHAHLSTQQLLVAVSGAFSIRLDDGVSEREFFLDDPTRALWVPPGLWRVIDVRAPSSVLLVLASTLFDEDDYLRERDAYLDHARRRDGAGS